MGEEHWYVESRPGARLAAWWLSQGHPAESVVHELTRSMRLSEVEAWIALDQARTWVPSVPAVDEEPMPVLLEGDLTAA